jgi:hypothetical protein
METRIKVYESVGFVQGVFGMLLLMNLDQQQKQAIKEASIKLQTVIEYLSND